ncbi:MAG: hypothetical protein ABSG53_23605 [Thermoguttaceae bacterium]|jgi:hypothetical protein
MSTQVHIPWTVFQQLQQDRQPASIELCLGREEALTAVLHQITGGPPTEEADIRKRFSNLLINRSSKYRHRRYIVENLARPAQRRCGEGYCLSASRHVAAEIAESVDWGKLVALVASLLPQADFNLLWDIATGGTYTEIAAAAQISVAALKARVFRIRERVRMSSVAPVIEKALA